MFSKSCEYGIRAILFIAANGRVDRMVGIGAICEAIEAPDHFTAKVLQLLCKKGLVSSRKGIHGGFYLNAGQQNNRLIDVVQAIDGDRLLTGCGLGLPSCSEEQPCPIHERFRPIRNDLKTVLEEKTIALLAESLKDGSAHLKTGLSRISPFPLS